MRQISGNKLLVKALKEEGVTTLFGYPGACTIDISDELYRQSGIDIILPRHEQALVHEADAYARTTGKVGVCLVTSGPGATNLVTGLATANYDSVPLVCFTGQVARHLIGNDAFQEVDIVGITRSITKYGVTVRNREDLGRIIKEAFYIAFNIQYKKYIYNKKEHSYECSFLISSFLSSRAASSQVLSAFVSLTSVFGMGTGGSSQLSPLNL